MRWCRLWRNNFIQVRLRTFTLHVKYVLNGCKRHDEIYTEKTFVSISDERFNIFAGTEFWDASKTVKFLRENEYFLEGDEQVTFRQFEYPKQFFSCPPYLPWQRKGCLYTTVPMLDQQTNHIFLFLEMAWYSERNVKWWYVGAHWSHILQTKSKLFNNWN